MAKWWRELIALAVTLIIAAIFVLFSNVFQECVGQIPSYEAYQQAPKGPGYVIYSLLAKIGCLGPFIDENANGIIALFTIVLTVSTVAMWWETKKISSGGEAQAKENKRAIAAAEKAANAAELSAQAAIGVHLPFINIESIESNIPLEPNVELGFQHFKPVIRIRNLGKTPAFVREIVLNCFPGKHLGTSLHYERLIQFPEPFVLDSGDSHQYCEFTATPPTAEQITGFTSPTDREGWMHVFGYISYADFLGQEHLVGFAYYWVLPTKKFRMDHASPLFNYRT